jgi:hypothetical protein
MKILTTFFLLLLASSCSNKNILPADNEIFTINYQQSISLDNNFTVEFSSVQESRCPEGVQCVREDAETETVYCVSGECISKKDFLPKSTYYSGDEVKVGTKNYSLVIEDFSPKTPKQSNQPSSYSLTLKIIEK